MWRYCEPAGLSRLEARDSIKRATKSPCPNKRYFFKASRCSNNLNLSFIKYNKRAIVVLYASSIEASRFAVSPYFSSLDALLEYASTQEESPHSYRMKFKLLPIRKIFLAKSSATMLGAKFLSSLYLLSQTLEAGTRRASRSRVSSSTFCSMTKNSWYGSESSPS